MVMNPYFKRINGIPTLIVNKKPFIAFAGELHNSSASNSDYMEEKVWMNVNNMNVNTIIAPSYWELIEPEENQFQFESVQKLIDQARINHKKIVLLWFGLWKNGISSYVPKWMKLNQSKYPFIEKKCGEKIYTVTPLCKEAIHRDALAFKQLMSFLHQYDSEQQTVIMVQIENEVGALGTDFDYSKKSKELFSKSVPKEIIEKMDVNGTWEESFGKEAKEYFMAYHYAKAIDYIAEFGKAEYSIPFFVNTWLEKYPARPGEYPTGGPTAKMAPFWKKITSNLIAFAPDIYVPNFSEVCEQYLSFQDNLIVPETRQDLDTIANLLYGVSKYNINCFSPFGIEDFLSDEIDLDPKTMSALAIDWQAFDCRGTGRILSNTYQILNGMMSLILETRGTKKMFPFYKSKESDRGVIFELEKCEVKVSFQNYSNEKVKSSGFIIETQKNEFYIVGINVDLKLQTKVGENGQIGIIDFEEGLFVDNVWQRKRILNGDERYNISIGNTTKVFRISYHHY